MARLALVYGLRLLPAEELESFDHVHAAIRLNNGNDASIALHVIEGSTEHEIRKQLMQSLDAFFEFYPEL